MQTSTEHLVVTKKESLTRSLQEKLVTLEFWVLVRMTVYYNNKMFRKNYSQWTRRPPRSPRHWHSVIRGSVKGFQSIFEKSLLCAPVNCCCCCSPLLLLIPCPSHFLTSKTEYLPFGMWGRRALFLAHGFRSFSLWLVSFKPEMAW